MEPWSKRFLLEKKGLVEKAPSMTRAVRPEERSLYRLRKP